jgi:hypothetical protein
MSDKNEKKEEEKKKNVPPPPGKPRRKKKTGASNAVRIPTGMCYNNGINCILVLVMCRARRSLFLVPLPLEKKAY